MFVKDMLNPWHDFRLWPSYHVWHHHCKPSSMCMCTQSNWKQKRSIQSRYAFLMHLRLLMSTRLPNWIVIDWKNPMRFFPLSLIVYVGFFLFLFFVLLTTSVKSDFILLAAGTNLAISSDLSYQQGIATHRTVTHSHVLCKLYRLLCVKLPGDQPFLKYSNHPGITRFLPFMLGMNDTKAPIWYLHSFLHCTHICLVGLIR